MPTQHTNVSLNSATHTHLCNSKVCDLDGAIGGEQQVAWLYVFVHDAPAVEVLQTVHQLNKVTGWGGEGRGGEGEARGMEEGGKQKEGIEGRGGRRKEMNEGEGEAEERNRGDGKEREERREGESRRKE